MSKGRLNFDPSEFAVDNYSRKLYLGASVMVVLMLTVILVLWTRLPDEVPLFFSRPWGESRLANKPWLFMLPGLSLMVVVVNLGMGRLYKEYDEIVKKSLATVAFISTFMLFVSLVGIFWSIL